MSANKLCIQTDADWAQELARCAADFGVPPSVVARQAWRVARDQIRSTPSPPWWAHSQLDGSEALRPLKVSFDPQVWAEIESEADRLHCMPNRLVIGAWRLAAERIRQLPRRQPGEGDKGNRCRPSIVSRIGRSPG